jgi:hypothetical protein
VANKWVFHSTEKCFICFLSNGLSYELDFCVINSPNLSYLKIFLVYDKLPNLTGNKIKTKKFDRCSAQVAGEKQICLPLNSI